MKRICAIIFLISFTLTIAGVISSCEFQSHEDPEHPMYVSYTISAGVLSFDGPQQVQFNIQNWIKDNERIYDKPVSYSTGDASEFRETDTEAVKNYEDFLLKFKAHLNKVSQDLAKGSYGNDKLKVDATYYVFAKRTQGKDGQLKYEQIEFVYPSSSSN